MLTDQDCDMFRLFFDKSFFINIDILRHIPVQRVFHFSISHLPNFIINIVYS